MRNLRKLTSAVLAIALVLTSMTAVFAADSATIANADKAVALKDLGLYAGQDANDPKLGLEDALTTQDSLIFLAKLFGYYETANKLTADQVSKALAKFDDAASISGYAKNVVAYSTANGILSGSTQNGKFFVGAKDTVTADRFATFMLRQMGYTVENYKQSVDKLAETKGSKVDATITGDLTRDVAVGIMYGALTAEKSSQKTVIADIVGDNADLKAKAVKAGLIVAAPIEGGSGSTGGSGSEELKGLTVSSKSVEKNKYVQLNFNEELDAGTVKRSNFTFKSVKGGRTVYFTVEYPVDDNKKVVRLNVPETLDDNTKYEVVVKNAIKDAVGNKMKQDYVTTFTTGDYTPPEIKKDECYVGKADGKIVIKFSEPMNESQMLDKSNYMVKPTGTGEYVKLGEDDKISKISNRIVLIDLKGEVDKPAVKVAPIMDLAGNKWDKAVEVLNIGKEAVNFKSAELIETNKIKVVFNTKIATFEIEDVMVGLNGTTTPSAISIASVESQTVNDDGNTEIVFVLDKHVNTDVTFTDERKITVPVTIKSKAVDTESKSISGTLLGTGLEIAVTDKVAPEIAMYQFKDDDDETPLVYIFGYADAKGKPIDPRDNYEKLDKGSTAFASITFTEAMDFDSMSKLSFTVDGYTVVDVLWVDTNENGVQDDTEYILYIKAKEDNTPARTSVTQVYNITDKNENTMASGSTWTIRDIDDYVK